MNSKKFNTHLLNDINKNQGEFLNASFKNKLNLISIIMICFLIIKNILYFFHLIFIFRPESNQTTIPHNQMKFLGENMNIFLLILAGFLTIKISSQIIFFFFILNLNMLIMIEYHNYNSNGVDNIFSIFLLLTDIFIFFYTINYTLIKNELISTNSKKFIFQLESYFGSFFLIYEELNFKLDLLKMNINNLIISSGYKKQLSWFLFNLNDYSFYHCESQGSKCFKNIPIENESLIKSCSTLDISI
jgi:hypothetical protein